MSTIAQIGDLLTAVIALGGFVALLIEYRRANAVKRADYLDKLIERFRGDSDIRDVMYDFQYGRFEYTENFHDEKNDMERKVDKALMYLSFVCYLEERKVITEREFSFFEVEVLMALNNPGVIVYLYNLYHFERHSGLFDIKKDYDDGKFTFSHLLKYAERKGIIDGSFYDSDSAEHYYPKFLNF